MDEKDRRDPPSIWLIDAERGVSTRLTSGEESGNPVWSPDRKRIAFAAAIDSPPNLYVRNADGTGAAERLFVSPNQSYPTDWSRDGAFIVGHTISPETAGDIWKIEVATRTLTPLFQSRFNEVNPRISPDGRWLTLYVERNRPCRGVCHAISRNRRQVARVERRRTVRRNGEATAGNCSTGTTTARCGAPASRRMDPNCALPRPSGYSRSTPFVLAAS